MDSDILSDLIDDHFVDEGDVTSFLNSPQNDDVGVTDGLVISRPISSQTGAVIAKIEKIFESIADSLLNEQNSLIIPLKTRPRTKPARDKGSPEDSTRSGIRNITFPNKSAREAWKFTVLVRILELSHEALVTGVVTTKRDIYYKDPELFTKQTVVDRYVDDIAYTFGVDRQALNVVAAAKGLIAGAFTATRKDDSVVNFAEPDGLLVPNPSNITTLHLSQIRWILIIEKEATFRTLSTNKHYLTSSCGPGILITAKGYPDILTRRFLHLLSTTSPSTPILALVDYDPDGLAILSTYKHGSVALAHETNISVPSIRWLGVRSADFLSTGKEGDVSGLLTLTKRDRRIATLMLGRGTERSVEEDEDWRRELQVMLMLNVKAEIQILGSGEKLGEWLDGKLMEMI